MPTYLGQVSDIPWMRSMYGDDRSWMKEGVRGEGKAVETYSPTIPLLEGEECVPLLGGDVERRMAPEPLRAGRVPMR